MVPNNITRDHVLKALAQIDTEGVPSTRDAKTFLIEYNENFYPQKFSLGLANKFANGQELDSDEFNAAETHSYLEKLGFKIVEKDVYSWEMISENVLSKTLDKSAFLHHGTGVPHQLLKFFGLEKLQAGEQKVVTLLLNEREYEAKILLDKQPTPRGRLLWKSDFSEVIQNRFPGLYRGFSDSLIKNQASAKLKLSKGDTENILITEFHEASPVSLEKGIILSGKEISELFGCSPQAGMRRGTKTNSLVIVSDHTKSLYDDRLDENSVFHYTGMGKSGDQRLDFMQNKTLAQSGINGVDVHLFEVFAAGRYFYQGLMYLAGEPYQELQEGEDGLDRLAWVFPLKPIFDGGSVAIPEEAFRKSKDRKAKKIAKLSDGDLLKKAKKTSARKSKRSVETTVHERNPFVAEYAKRRANGICQLCNQDAPFNNKKNEPYLESHHIIWLAKGGEDTINNTVALCPNCHKKMHILDSREDKEKLKKINLN